jgi:hypothetical protein
VSERDDFTYHDGVAYDFVLTGKGGTTIAVDYDLNRDDEPVAIVHLKCPMGVLGGSGEIDLPGVRGLQFEAADGDSFYVDANGSFTADEVEQIVAALRHAVRPVVGGD